MFEKLVEKGPELLANAARLVPQRLAGPLPVPRPLPLPTATPLRPSPTTGSTEAVGAPSASPESRAPNPESQPLEDQVSPELADRIAQNVVKAAIVRMLFNGDSGDDAAHYAEMAHEPLARTLAHLLKTNPAALRDDPILGQAMTHVNVMAFSKEFVNYFEEEEQPEAVPPASASTDAAPASA